MSEYEWKCGRCQVKETHIKGASYHHYCADYLDELTRLRDERDRYRKALEMIFDIAIDYDGYRTTESLMSLIDELKEISKQALSGVDEANGDKGSEGEKKS